VGPPEGATWITVSASYVKIPRRWVLFFSRKNAFETFASLTRRREFSHIFNLSLSLFFSLLFSLFREKRSPFFAWQVSSQVDRLRVLRIHHFSSELGSASRSWEPLFAAKSRPLLPVKDHGPVFRQDPGSWNEFRWQHKAISNPENPVILNLFQNLSPKVLSNPLTATHRHGISKPGSRNKFGMTEWGTSKSRCWDNFLSCIETLNWLPVLFTRPETPYSIPCFWGSVIWTCFRIFLLKFYRTRFLPSILMAY